MTKTFTLSYNARNHGWDISFNGRVVANVFRRIEAIEYATERKAKYVFA